MLCADSIYRYWSLKNKANLGNSLTMVEMNELVRIRRALTSGDTLDVVDEMQNGYLRCEQGFANRVRFSELAIDGVVAYSSVALSEGSQVEIHIDTGESSYRFVGQVSWQCEGDDGDLITGIQFEGAALSIGYGKRGRAPSQCAFAKLLSAA